MKIIKKVIVGLLAMIFLIAFGVFVYLQILKPSYKGTVHLSGIKNTEVVFDSIGVPHIFSDSEVDAMKALGYVHAKERLWQMELLRRIASGRLAEILGKDLVEVDAFFLNLGIDETVAKQVNDLNKNPKVKQLVDAYLHGVNTFIDEGTSPIEFTLLGIEKEHYQPKDMYYVTAYMAFSFADAFKTDPLLSHVQKKYGEEYLKTLAIDFDERTFYQKTYDERIQAVTSINKVLSKLPFPQFIGSNGMAIGPQKTTTGKVILENDPHIGYAQPCVWYQAHIKTPDYENYGFYLGLLPFPLLAHNREYAYGITMFENDDINFYRIKNVANDSTKYQIASGVYEYEYITKKIEIKGEEPKEIQVKKTILGTVFNQQIKTLDNTDPITIQWVFNEQPITVLQTAYGLNHAKDIYDFESKLPGISAPGLNYVYGDMQDNIALWSVAKLYEFKKNVRTQFILDGQDAVQTEKKWLPFSDNPKAINPPSAYVITSNTQPDSINGRLFQGYYLSEDRGEAIQEGIEAKKKISVVDVQSLANSHTNKKAVANVRAIAAGIKLDELSPFELKVLDRLIKWRGNHQLENIGTTIYYKITARLFKNTFRDELTEDLFNDFANTSLAKRTLNKFMYEVDSKWWDNVTTLKTETFKDIVTKTFQESVSDLKTQLGDDITAWKWGKVHTIEHEHALAKMDLLKKIFNVGAFPIVGGNETINNTMWAYSDDGVYKTNAGPSTRRIIDFSNVENSYAILPTGQSGNFLSPYYNNQAEDYVKGKYHKMLLNEEEIRKSKNVLKFKE